jgi:hypothetical protein
LTLDRVWRWAVRVDEPVGLSGFEAVLVDTGAAELVAGAEDVWLTLEL